MAPEQTSAPVGHTAGPWFVGEAFHHAGERQNVTPVYARHPDRLDGRYLIAWCHQNAVPKKQVKPNARLIAAAPELREALELLLHDRTPWTVQCAQAALAKAGGEQSAEWLEIPAFLRRGND